MIRRTGFHPGLSWIDLPIFGDDGEPLHEGGVVKGEPGLYFVGRTFVYAASSVMVHGVGRDAARVAETIACRVSAPSRTSSIAPRPQDRQGVARLASSE